MKLVGEVHYEARHPATKKVGNYETPLEYVATACSTRWTTRPRRTGVPRLVDCPHCLDWMAVNHQLVVADVSAVLKRPA